MPDPGQHHRSRVGGWPLAIIGIILVLLTYELRYTLIPFVFAAVIGFVLEPVIAWCTSRTGGRRWPAASLFTLLIFAFVLGGGYWLGQQSVQEIVAAVQKLPTLLHEALNAVAGPGGVTLFGTHYTPQELTAAIIDGATNLVSAAQIFFAIKIGAGVLAAVALTLVLIPYFLVSGPRIAAGALWLIPPERRGSVETMLPVLVPMLRRYVVGLCCIVLYAAVLIYLDIGAVFHVPGAGLLAVVFGFLELIPVIGPISSLLLVGLAAVGTGGLAAIVMMAWALAVRLSIDNAFSPLVLGSSARVHPIVVIFGFVIGAVLFGIIGLLLAVPTAATIRIVLRNYYAEPVAPDGDAEPEMVRVRGRLDSRAKRPR